MFKRLARRADKRTSKVVRGTVLIGDAASITAGGSGSSIEDKRYPYG
ncbi:MAG: albusnodin family lasso peptide [Micromonosporaceae bacterium]|nr:albusnodin family lasso peptide [Micromonosporaceae bacterium]